MDDLLFRGGMVAGQPRDIAIRGGRIRQIAPRIEAEAAETLDIHGKLVVPGFVESHIHPDKAFIADRAPGLQSGGPTPQTIVAELKKSFTVEDIRQRASRVLEIGTFG
jgi:cytosine deaminase